MAIWYTDNITGSNTTGDGTAGNPYKTIARAVGVAANDDTIRVAGSGWSAVSGTVSSNTNVSATTLQTSANLTSELTAGVSLISIKDPQFGDRKLIYKVTAVTSTTITLHLAPGLTPGTNYEIEKVTTNHYTASATSTIFENCTGVGTTTTGIKIEAGWTGGFTAQDGITVITYTVASTATSGTGISMLNTQTGWSFNNFCFSALATGISSTAYNTIALGNIWLPNTRIYGALPTSNTTNIPGVPMNLYITTGATNQFGNLSNSNNLQFTLNNLYCISDGGTSYAVSLDTQGQCTIENMYVKQISANNFGTATAGQIINGSFIVNNLILGWATDTTSQSYLLFGSGSVGKLVTNTNLGNTTNKLFMFANAGVSQAQWINTSINIDNDTCLSPTIARIERLLSYSFVKDSEGEKLLYYGAVSVFADPTIYDTGTNSLRIIKSKIRESAVPIKQHYIPVGSTSAITFTIRAKSTGSNTTIFALQPTSNYISGNTLYILPETKTLTSSWADYTYTISASNVTAMAGNYIWLSCVTSATWSQTYVWIDSVTIS